MLCFFLLITLSTVLALVFIIVQRKEKPWLSLCLKSFSSLSFCILGIVSFFLKENAAISELFLILGLIAGLVGDVLLAGINFAYPDKHTVIKSGIIAFSIAQIFSFTALAFLTEFRIAPFPIALFLTLMAFFLAKPLKLDFGKSKYFVLIYSFLLFLTVSQSFFTLNSSIGSVMCVIGFLLFLLSDLVLETIFFRKDAETVSLTYVNLSLYYAAQILIASAVYMI